MGMIEQAAPVAARGTRSLTVVEAIREALHEEMARDPRVVVLGEDIGQLGGVFRATDGLLTRFGEERVIDTPMMELGIVGLAVGMAMKGLRPVAEIQFGDFIHAAADHIMTDAARMRFRSNNDWTCPLVVRTAYGGGFRGGPYHSQSVEAYYCHVPGLKVVAPSFPADAKGLLIASIRDPDPVLFLEHKRTYRAIRGEVPEGDFALQLGQARVVRAGGDATVVAWGWVLHESLAAAEQLAEEGIDVEVIDPRTLVPLDEEAILESVRRTGRLCVVHEDTRTLGFGAELAALAAESALDELRAPVRRVCMPDVAGIPASGPMEDFLIPDRTRIAAALRELVRRDAGTRGRGDGEIRRAGERESGRAGEIGVVATTGPATWVDWMVASGTQVPQAASVVEVDLSRVARRIEWNGAAWMERGIEPSYTPFFAQALVAAVAAVPQVNAAYDGEARAIRRFHALHLGLSVPGVDGKAARHAVVRDADTRNLIGLAIEAQGAHVRGSTGPEILAEATITLTDFGPGSALFAVPSVLPGQAAAIRAGAVEERLVARDRGFFLAPTVFLCASVDHRVLDGMDAGALLGEMKRFLEQYPLEPQV
jgi:2-oxoisovalerate dehydrogenase E1 component beta subunit